MNIMWSVSVCHLAVCGAVTVLMLVLGLVYTYFRQKGMKSSTSVHQTPTEATDPKTDKWHVADTAPTQEDRNPPESDPMEFCSHIQGRIKQTKQRVAQQKIESKMTEKERFEEREIQRRQLEEIFKMMEEQKETFGISNVSDVQEQMKMYVQ